MHEFELSLQIFGKKTQISNLTIILQVGAELFYTDGLTDMTKSAVVFRNFENAPKNETRNEKVPFKWQGRSRTLKIK